MVLSNGLPSGTTAFFAPSFNGFTVVDQVVLLYADAGTEPHVQIHLAGGQFFPGGNIVATLTGYLVDLSITAQRLLRSSRGVMPYLLSTALPVSASKLPPVGPAVPP